MAGTLYGTVLSPNFARVLVVAHELNVKLQIKLVDLGSGEHKKEPFLSLNPFGSVPAYVSDDGVTLFESRAIGKYIDIQSGGKLLHIKDHKAYGRVENWASVESSTWAKNAFPLFLELIVKPNFQKQTPDQTIINSNKADFHKTLQAYEKHFAAAKTTFIAGNDLSIADLFHLPFVAPLVGGHKPALPDLLNPFPLVKAWFDKLLALPSWKQVEKDQAEFVQWLGQKN
jgi:glutathione S-transferase